MPNNKWEFEPSETDLENLREWLRKMPHIVQHYDDKFLAGFVRGCKGSLQKTKNVIENFNSLGYRYPYLFGDLDPLYPRLQDHLSVTYIFPLPKRLEDGTLVTMALKIPEKDDDSKYHALQIIRYFLQWLYIYLWENNYGPGKLVVIIDGKDHTFGNFKAMTPVVMRDLIQILQLSLPVRPKALHLIHLPPPVAKVFNFLKALSPNKFKNKMYFHSSMETLYEYVPKETLPKEYGGGGENISTLSNQWKDKVESYRDGFLKESLKMRSLDSIRPKLNEMDITSETFTQLNID